VEIPTFDVAVALEGMDPDRAAEAGEGDGYKVHRVIVLGPDQMAAERMARKLGFRSGSGDASETLALSLTYLFVFLVLHRQGVLPGEWPTEKGRLLSLEKIDPPATVDPTRPTPDTPSP
jgi:hypothetical protein